MGNMKEEGATYVADNGYHHTKVNGKWRLTHHLLAEAALGRPLSQGERVYFKDGDRSNLDPDNIEVRGSKKSKEQRVHALREKIAVLQAELDDLLSS